MTPRPFCIVLSALSLFGCAAPVGEGASASAEAVKSSADCSEYAAPESNSTCDSCSGSSCQANGCFGGYYCHASTGQCTATVPKACKADSGSGKDSGKDGGGNETDGGPSAGPVIVSSFDTPSSTPSAGLEPVIDAINGAQQSIQMEMFHLTVASIADALANAAQRGVNVQLIIDQGNWNSHTPASISSTLANGGVQVTPSSTAFRITHVKSFVVDGQTANATAYVMSLNLTSPFVETRDYAVVTRDPGVVAEFLSVFSADLVNARNSTDETPTLSDPNLLWSPVNSEARLVALVNSAQKTLIATAENIDSGSVAQALASAASRGVDVRFIAPLCDEGDDPAYNIPALTMLNQAGAQAHAMPAPSSAAVPYMHAKMMVVDGREAYVGSVNFSVASMTDARELGITFSDASAIAMLTTAFEHDWAQTPSTIASNASCPTTANERTAAVGFWRGDIESESDRI